MPGLFKLLIVSPVADQAGVQSLTGFHTNTPLYLEADSQPRPQWGGWTSTAFSSAQEAQVPTWRTSFPGTRFTIYHAINQKTVPQDTLEELGLTTRETDLP